MSFYLVVCCSYTFLKFTDKIYRDLLVGEKRGRQSDGLYIVDLCLSAIQGHSYLYDCIIILL